MTTEIKEDWPRDVILDLVGYLDGRGYPETVEVLADALVSFEQELRCRGRAPVPAPASASGAVPALRVITGGK